MILTLLAAIGCILAISALAIFIVMTIYDMRLIRANRRTLHFRRQPFVAVIVDDTTSDESLRSIAQNDYRRCEIIFAGEPVKSDIVLELKRSALLAPTAIRHAVQQLHSMRGCEFVEIKPDLPMPDNLRQLFYFYTCAALAPFISVRAQLGIRPSPHSSWPVLKKSLLTNTWQTYAYRGAVWLAALVNAIILAYLIYMAVWLGLPELFLLYLSAFWLWLIVSIWDYPHLSLTEKLVYTALAPVSFGYFIVIALAAPAVAPMRMLKKLSSRFFSRSIHQTVV